MISGYPSPPFLLFNGAGALYTECSIVGLELSEDIVSGSNSRFVHSLSPDTFAAMNRRLLLPYGFLLAPNNATSSLRVLGEAVVKRRREFFVDNGNFSHIGKVRKAFREEAKELRKLVSEFEKKLGRSARSGELPERLTDDYKRLAKRVRQACDSALLDDEEMLSQQLGLSPSALIGTEDITMASWLSLDIERRYTRMDRRVFRAMNRTVAQRATQLIVSLPRNLRHRYYPVASAVSYNTAFDAGREFGASGIRNISMGFGAYMADSNFVDHLFVGRRRIDFGANLPARYTRTVVVAKGFWAGYLEEFGRPPMRFHFLGLGAPIMLPLVTLCAKRTSELTFDATSPIKDATRGGTLYVDKPAPLKIRTRKIALRLAKTEGGSWDCPCPFCVDFVHRHPFRYELGRDWFGRNTSPKVLASDLRPRGGLFEAYSLLSEPTAGTDLRREVNFARIGHNHWITERILSSVRRAARQRRLQTRVSNMVDDYMGATSPQFANALKLTLSFATEDDM